MKHKVVTGLALVLSISSSGVMAESLRDIYELALENDATLKAQEAQYLAGREQEKLALSRLLPQVSANYKVGNTDQDRKAQSFDFSNGINTINTRTNTDLDTDGYGLSLDQAIFDLPAWFGFKSGKELTRQAEATFAADQQNLIVRVVDAYLAVLRAQDNLEASRARERAFERQLEQTQQRFEVGLIAITDVYESQAAYDGAKVSRIVDENNVMVALERLSVLTGQSHSNLHLLQEDFNITPPEPLDRAAWVDFAMNNNFRLKAAEYGEEAARQQSKSKAMEHTPKIRGNYTYSDEESDGSLDRNPPTQFDTSPDSEIELNAWQVRLDLPLYSGGAISSERRRAAQEFNASREQRIQLSRDTVTSTRSLHMTVVSDVSRVAARKQSIVSTRSALDATQAGYEVGTRNVVDVLNAQNAVVNAQRDYANARYDYIINMMRLKEQAGTLSPEDINELDSYLVAPPPPKASGQ